MSSTKKTEEKARFEAVAAIRRQEKLYASAGNGVFCPFGYFSADAYGLHP